MTRNPIVLAALCGTLALSGCAGKDSTPAKQLTSVATEAAGSLSVELLTETRLETGRTPIFLRVKDAAGQPVTNATVTFTPMMVMSPTMSHSAPMLGAPVLEPGGDYRCDVVFQMAGSWSATATVTLPGASPVTAEFLSLDIADSHRAQPFLYTDPTTGQKTKYIASLNLDAPAKVGQNPVTVTLHRVDGMMFVPVEDATIVLVPEMPSMGHGSSGNVDPTLTAPGIYEGQLSFTMAGTWVTTATFTRAGVTISPSDPPVTFELTF